MIWFNFLHLYQPGNIDNEKIAEAYELSYAKLFRIWQKYPQAKMTINISGCLLERLSELGKEEFLSGLKNLIATGQLEVVGTAAYHPLLPLIEKEEAVEQIKEQEELLHRYLGVDYRPAGFFLPEMAADKQVLKLIKKLGYKYVILDPVSARTEVIPGKKYLDKASGLEIIFRDRNVSRSYAPDYIISNDFQIETLFTATDAEVYGLRHIDPTGELEKVLVDARLEMRPVKELLNDVGEEIELQTASWESEVADIKIGKPLGLWSDKANKIHVLLWKLANLAQKFNSNDYYYRWHLKRGLASCTMWWASGHDFSSSFGPIAWSPDEVERGVNDLVRAIRCLPPKYNRYKIKAEKLRAKIISQLWLRHWRR